MEDRRHENTNFETIDSCFILHIIIKTYPQAVTNYEAKNFIKNPSN
jgi:hypothetical protein